MKKKILLCLFITLISLMTSTTVFAEEQECAPADSVKFKINDAENQKKVYLYLYTWDNNSLLSQKDKDKNNDGKIDADKYRVKEGNFYNQSISTTGNTAFCLDMGKGHGANYQPSEDEYKRVIASAGDASAQAVLEEYFKKILTFDEVVKEAYRKEDRKTQALVGSYVDDLSYIIAQLGAWTASENPSNPYINQGFFPYIIASVYCSLYVYPDTVNKDTGKSPCYWDPSQISNGTASEEFMKVWNEHEERFDWFSDLWMGGFHMYSSYRDYDGIPTIYKPSSSNHQRLLSEYFCKEPPESCWRLDVNIPTLCQSDENSGFVKDLADWKCIFSSIDSTKENVRTHYKEDLSNDYCNVYCREEIVFELPNSGTTTVQGSYLAVNVSNDIANQLNIIKNNITPIRYESTKTCRPTSAKEGMVNFEKFENDYSAANSEMVRNWSTYQFAKANYNACLNAMAGESYNTYKCQVAWEKNPTKVAEYKAYKIPEEDYQKIYERNPKWASLSEEELADMIATEEQFRINAMIGSLKYDYCSDYIYAKDYSVTTYWYGRYASTLSGWTDYENITSDDKNSVCANYATIIADAYSLYIDSKSYRDSLLEKIKSCTTTKISDIEYNTFKPVVRIFYEEEVYENDAGWVLQERSSKRAKFSSLYIDGNATTDSPEDFTEGTIDRTIESSICDNEGSTCSYGEKDYTTARWWEASIYYIKEYTLSDDVYRYVNKDIGESVHTINRLDGFEYADMVIGNLPIHYSTVPNKKYDFQLEMLSFGSSGSKQNKFNQYIFQARWFNGKLYNDLYDLYECEYGVTCNPMISDNPACSSTPSTGDGLNLVYRTISLFSKEAAFPGINGEGRIPGPNWNDDILIDKYIVHNRGVYADEIYSELSPMYEIELTPAIMRKFRDYNQYNNSQYKTIYKDTGKERSGILGYTSYNNFECNNDGLNCKSNLIRGLISGYNDIKVTGCGILSGIGIRKCSSYDIAW